MENLINCIGLKTEFPKSLFRRTYVYADSIINNINIFKTFSKIF